MRRPTGGRHSLRGLLKQSNSENPTWSDRLASLRQVRPLLALIWETSPPLFVTGVLLRLLRAALPVSILWVSKLIIDAVVRVAIHHRGHAAGIWKLIALEISLAMANDLLTRATTLVDSLLADDFGNHVNIRLMQHSVTLDLSSFEDPDFHDRLERARRQSSGRLTLLTALLNSLQDFVSLILLSSSLVVFSPWLMVLLVASVLPAFWGETKLTALEYSVLFRRTPQRRQLDYLRFLGASSLSAKEVKAFGLGAFLVDRYQRLSRELIGENRRLAIRHASAGSLFNVIATAGYYGGYAFVVVQTLSGLLSIGTFTFLTRTFNRSRAHVERIFSNLTDISEEAIMLKNLFGFFELKPSITSPPHALPAPRPIREGFEFRDVSFAYPGSERYVLKNLNMRIFPSEKVALIGENGTGKTTLAKLIGRFYDPSEGRIFLDGVDLREYDIETLRREIGVIFQDYMRYDMLVSENIGVGNIEFLPDRTRLETAARKSSAARLIERLPKGYDQMLGRRFEDGVELSGGEWQKLALARAYLREAQLLILDEPTASLDARAEYEVFRRLVDLARGRMAVLISHRFSTVRMADRILVLGAGAIIEQGTHHELLARGGRYSELFEIQAAGYR
jgi:ATP-binding cassette, subfamily B, bacterial